MEKIVSFLRNNVNGRTLYTDERTYRFENGGLVGTYSDQVSFSNMFFSKVRFTMDTFIVSKEMIMEADTGKEILNVYSSALYRYSLAMRRSTGDATGTRTFIASSLMSDPIPAESTVSGIYNMRLENNELSWIDDQMMYRDQIVAEGSFIPIAFMEKCRFFVTDEGLTYEREVECFEVDPKTMKRIRSIAKFPLFISKERRT